MLKGLSSVVIVGLMSGAAWAADPTVPPADPEIVAPAPGGGWTGAYAGLQVGQLDAEAPDGLTGRDPAYGLHGGYRYDFGRFILGGELDYDFSDTNLGAGIGIDSVLRGKIQAGYDLGQAFAYVTGGIAGVDTSLGRDTGKFYGLGVVYSVTDEFTLGGEILDHSFDNLGGTGVGADATTVTIRGSFNF